MVGYQNLGTINRTVLLRRPVGCVDWNALPPWHWCVRCGGEVFVRGQSLCHRCKNKLRIDN